MKHMAHNILTLLITAFFTEGAKTPVATNKTDGLHDDVLSLVLDKPLGLFVEPSSRSYGDAIVSFLLDPRQKPGSAHKLPRNVQEQLVGSRIVGINQTDTSTLSFSQVIKLIDNADGPIAIDFNLNEDDDEEENADLTIVRHAPHVHDDVRQGTLSPIRWEDTGESIDSYASRIGLPKSLIPTIQSYLKRTQLAELLTTMLYTNPCHDGGPGRFYRSSNGTVDEELLWYATRPSSLDSWVSDVHHFSPADEKTYETLVDVLFQGGFRSVVETIGSHFNLQSLAIQGVGFMGVTYCEDGPLHTDFQSNDGKSFNLLLPIHPVPGSGPELTVAGWKAVSIDYVTSNCTTSNEQDETMETEFTGAALKYTKDVAILMGDNTWHQTRACDNRPMHDARIMMNVFLVDITGANADPTTPDTIDVFPVSGMTEWLWAQEGRHWRNDMCMDRDRGRKSFKPRDTRFDCMFRAERGECESQSHSTRLLCPVSCGIYIN